MAIDFKALGAKAAAEGANMTVATTSGGGDYTPPAAGPCRMRLVAYIEAGKQKSEFQGVVSYKPTAIMTFELSGKNHPPKDVDGEKTPIRINVEMPISMNEKANFFKLFTRMNYDGKAEHMVQLLGEGFRGEVHHRKFARTGEDKAKPDTWTGIDVSLKGPEGYSIQAPRYQDPETDQWKPLPVDPAITPLKGFLWDYANKEMWDSLYIDGFYSERKDKAGNVTAPPKSKNKYQDMIRTAQNFPGSPISQILAGSVDLPQSEKLKVDKPAPINDTAMLGDIHRVDMLDDIPY
jgi:hypothetical protein